MSGLFAEAKEKAKAAASSAKEKASLLSGKKKTDPELAKTEEAKKDETPPKPALSRQKSDVARGQDFIAGLKDLPDDSPIKQGIRCFCKYGVKPAIIICMVYIWIGKKLYWVYTLLPMNLLKMVFGVGLCFFGGMYYAVIAAVEAALNLGGKDMWEHLQICWDEGSLVAVASLEDDKKDEDKNGVADVQEISTNELINRKAKVAMMAVKDPMRLQQAVVSLMNVYVAVIATLKFQFAKTVAIALGIGNMLTLPANRLLGPMLAAIYPKDMNHWVPFTIDTSIKVIMVIVAGTIQSFISAFYSGLRGGKMFADSLFNIMDERGWIEKFPDSIVPKPYDPDSTYVDEAIAYPLAAAGFYFQVTSGFALGFPYNLILLPLTIVEYFLRFQIFT